MNENINPNESYREVFAWLRGGDTTPNPEMENRFIDIMAAMVQKRIEERAEDERLAEATRRRNARLMGVGAKLSLRALMEEEGLEPSSEEETTLEAKPDTPSIPEETKQESDGKGLDSIDIAKALTYIGQINDHSLNMSQLQTIMYIIYGVWLAQKGERLTAEHPQMWQFGPVFPRAYNRLKKEPGGGETEYNSLKESEPELLSYMENCFRRYGWTPATVLGNPHVSQGSPWAQARKENPDKWGAALSDTLIGKWFGERLAKKQ